LPYQHPDTSSSWHLFVAQVENRKQTYDKLKELGIATQVHYIPVPHQPFHCAKPLRNSDTFYQRCLSLPIYVDLSSQEQQKVIDSLCIN